MANLNESTVNVQVSAPVGKTTAASKPAATKPGDKQAPPPNI